MVEKKDQIESCDTLIRPASNDILSITPENELNIHDIPINPLLSGESINKSAEVNLDVQEFNRESRIEKAVDAYRASCKHTQAPQDTKKDAYHQFKELDDAIKYVSNTAKEKAKTHPKFTLPALHFDEL